MLTKKQQYFIDEVMKGSNIFLTGKAGTGKSFVVNQITSLLKQEGVPFICVAPTGIAANNIDGQTIHSLFAITPHGIQSYETCNFVGDGSKKVLNKCETIIIDEVSMLRPDILDAMHWTLIKNGSQGGLINKQVIFVGDLKQLPAVLTDNDRSVLYKTYDGDTFLFAKVIKKLNLINVELDEVVRQSDPEFIEHLNIIRDGGRSEYFRKFVSENPEGIILAPYNATVKKYNEEGLKKQPGDTFTFKAVINGSAKITDFNLEETVNVKNGCKIMYLVNSKDNPLKNGTLGIFVSYNDCHYIRVGNVDYALNKVQMEKKKYVYNEAIDDLELKTIGSIEQYPIKLAYALSIHKAQGLTFDLVTIDLSRPCFQKGQMYVALSRVKSPNGLKIVI